MNQDIYHYRPFIIITEAEFDNFVSECRRFGKNPEDFSMSEEITQFPEDGEISPIRGRITISTNGNSRTYNTGHLFNWPAEFIADLKSRFFD